MIPTPTTPIECYVAVAREIDRRLEWHSEEGKGRLLDGMFYDRGFTQQLYGVNKLPMIQPFEFSGEEEVSLAGHSVDPSTGRRQLHRPAMTQNRQRLFYFVLARKIYGWFARDPQNLDPNPEVVDGGLGIMQWVARVKDAMEFQAEDDDFDHPDPSLNTFLKRPLKIDIRENFLTEQSFMVLMEVEITTDFNLRGRRSSLVGL